MFKAKSNRKQGASLGLLSGHYAMFSAPVCCVRLGGRTFGWVRDGEWAIGMPILTQDKMGMCTVMSLAGLGPVVSVLTVCGLDGWCCCCCFCWCCYSDLQQNYRKLARKEIGQLASLVVTVRKTGPTISSFHLTHTSWVECCVIIVFITNIHSIIQGKICCLWVLLSFRILIIVIVVKNHNYYYEGHLESKERFAIKKYLLIIGKKKNMQVLSHTFIYFST